MATIISSILGVFDFDNNILYPEKETYPLNTVMTNKKVFLPKTKTPIRPVRITIEINLKKNFPLLLCALEPFVVKRAISPNNNATEPAIM
jgi:hypothetical protein